MEACAENDVEFMVFDRPNPNGFYVDGPVLESGYESFVGKHHVPIVHGLTIGEYAKMINGEGWLSNGARCELTIIPCENYTHKSYYEIPVKPSPNLPNMTSIMLYPGLCLFEGTQISIGRGTDFPFQVAGHPEFSKNEFFFKPRSIPEASKYPKHEGEICFGYDLRNTDVDYFFLNKKIDIKWLLLFFNDFNLGESFFTGYFDKLAGTDKLRKQIIAGLDEQEIRQSWVSELNVYKNVRKKYLVYPDFE